jgi:chemotaxis protein MotB
MAGAASKPQIIVKVIRKRGHGSGHHGGAWKVAYADFITCMFALFMVLWLLTQADLQLRQDIARYFRNASVLSGGSAIGASLQTAKTKQVRPLEAALTVVQGSGEDLEALRGRAREIQKAIERTPELAAVRENVRVQVTEEGLEIQIMDSGANGRGNLLFDISSAALKPALVTLLGEVAAELGKLPNRIEIGGHTDARLFALSSALSNWDLSFARANNARQVMEARGLYPNQVLRVTAYADTKLFNPQDPLADENRRLSVLARRETPTGSGRQTGQAATRLGTDPLPPPFVSPGLPPV